MFKNMHLGKVDLTHLPTCFNDTMVPSLNHGANYLVAEDEGS